MICDAFAQVPGQTTPNGQALPDLQVIIVGGMPDGDVVNVTYPDQPTSIILQRDLTALGTSLNTDPGQAKITNDRLPDSDGMTPMMTSITMKVQGAAPLTSGTLPVERVIFALRPYRSIDITYIMPPSYRYTGLHQYSDPNVTLSMSQSGSTYLFKAQILNTNFATLSLPTSENSAAQTNGSTLEQNRPGFLWERLAGCLIVAVLATLIGWGVFRILTKMQKTEA